ncbi:SDR family oxidoreductase [Sandarakinorhabdus sp. DWP1-3-1]|uniref:SDR family oxidoreductase n=1 Tax=Sandarakinorhabdus sp. DWP1-3-1 TaxID=2804627 RepID=UPI003CE8D332
MPIILKPVAAQRIVITGASSGIGLAIAEAAAATGARLMLSARNEPALREIADRLALDGADVAILAADMADEDAAERIATAATDRFGGFDTWVNNAAAGIFGTVSETPIADQRRVFDVGYWGTVAGSLAAARRLRQTGGAIINIGSVLGDRTMIQQGSYSAMKHAVKGFTDALRVELLEADAPVAVTLIKPSAMHTPFPQHARNFMDAPARLPPVLYDPRLVARAVLFAAAHPRRAITVGSFGEGATWGDMLAPGLLDRAMASFGTEVQQTGQAPPAETADNLWESRSDGSVESNQPQSVRRTSLWLEAQLRPVAATLIAAGLVALPLAIAQARQRQPRLRQRPRR